MIELSEHVAEPHQAVISKVCCATHCIPRRCSVFSLGSPFFATRALLRSIVRYFVRTCLFSVAAGVLWESRSADGKSSYQSLRQQGKVKEIPFSDSDAFL